MLGPSGSGKTTTLRMIAGFELPTAGRILLHGEDVSRQPPFERDVNTVFQDYALFPHMTVADNVAYGLVVKKVPRDERTRRVADALRMVRLEGFDERKPGQLSGGQRQRVALARALVNRPRVLLLDEPLGALDLKLREEMQIELKSIQQQVGITFIYVTHDQEEALTMSDRLAVFNNGPHRTGRRTGGRLRAAGHPVRRRVRRDVEPPERRRREGDRRRAGHVHRSARRRSTSRSPARRRSGRDLGPRPHPRRSSTSGPTRASSSPSMPAPSSSSPNRTWRRPRSEALALQGKAVRLDLEATAQLPRRDRRRPIAPPGHPARLEEEHGQAEDRRGDRGDRHRRGRLLELGGGVRETERPDIGRCDRGRAQPRRLGRVRGRRNRRRTGPDGGYDWVTPFETATGCKVNGQGRRRLVQDGPADEDRRVRRRVRVGRRDAPADRRRRRRSRQHRPDPELQERLRGPEEPAPQHGRRRRPTACPHGRGANVLMYDPTSSRDHRQLERRLRRRLGLQGQGHGLQLRDLHRRRRALPDEDEARPQDHQPLRARRDPVQGGRRPAQGAARTSSASTGAPPRTRSTGSPTATWSSARRGCTRPNMLEAAGGDRSRRSCRRKARPAGPTPG